MAEASDGSEQVKGRWSRELHRKLGGENPGYCSPGPAGHGGGGQGSGSWIELPEGRRFWILWPTPLTPSFPGQALCWVLPTWWGPSVPSAHGSQSLGRIPPGPESWGALDTKPGVLPISLRSRSPTGPHSSRTVGPSRPSA